MDIPTLPNPDTQAWEDMVDFMREDLDNNMMHTRLISKTKELLKSQGRDFDAEFNKWKKEKSNENEIYRSNGTTY